MKNTLFVSLLTFVFLVATVRGGAPADSEKLTRMLQQSTLTLLKEGNIRYADGESFHPNLESERRTELASAGQEPLATVLACSDSRDPVELIFDRGVGDLFVVRVAGNVAGLSELATIEYGVAHLNTPVLIVMGHTKCGAVTAATQAGELHGHLPSLISLIKPAAEKAKVTVPAEQLVSKAVELNVWQQIENIFAKSAVVREQIAAGKVQVVGAIYDIATGKVEWLGLHPENEQLVQDAKNRAGAETQAASHATPHENVPAQAQVQPVPAPVPAPAEPVKHAAARGPEPTKSVFSPIYTGGTTRSEAASSHH